MDNLLLIRAIGLPALMLISFGALAVARTAVHPPARGFLVALWGSTLLLFADATASAVLLWADEAPADIAQSTGLISTVLGIAPVCLLLGLALGWKTRVEGERFLVAIVRPPATVNTRSLRNWAIVPLLFLWLGLTAGAFAATYALLSYVTHVGR